MVFNLKEIHKTELNGTRPAELALGIYEMKYEIGVSQNMISNKMWKIAKVKFSDRFITIIKNYTNF